MHDLNTINRLNEDAVAKAAALSAADGNYVLTKYTGLNYVGFDKFADERARNAAAFSWVNANPSHRSGTINPPGSIL